MKIRLMFILAFAFIGVVSATAQTRTVTNDDLEIYRQKRVAAERDLRENYERLGFPSPAELEKQIERSRAEKIQFAAYLEAVNFQREQLEIERQRAENEAAARSYQLSAENNQRNRNDFYNGYVPNGAYGFSGFGFSNYQANRFNRNGFGRNNRRNYATAPLVEYRNNLPVIVRRPPPRIFAPRQNGNGRRN